MIVFSACFISVVHGYNQELKHSCSFNTANRQNDFIEVLEKRLVLLQNLNIPKDSNNDEFIKHLLENKDYKKRLPFFILLWHPLCNVAFCRFKRNLNEEKKEQPQPEKTRP